MRPRKHSQLVVPKFKGDAKNVPYYGAYVLWTFTSSSTVWILRWYRRHSVKVEISSWVFIRCKIKRRLIISSLITSKLEMTIFILFCITPLITKYWHLNTYFLKRYSPLFVPLAFQLLTFYHNSSIETKFWSTEQYIELLAFYHEIWLWPYIVFKIATSPFKRKHIHNVKNQRNITSAANQDQPAHRVIETSSS